MSTANFNQSTWDQLTAASDEKKNQQHPLPPDVHQHIKVLITSQTGTIPLDTWRWLQECFRAYVQGDKHTRLDEVMGLVPAPSQRDWRTIDRLSSRNAWLVRAVELLHGVSEYKQRHFLELSDQVAIFEEAFWPDWKDCLLPPEDATPFRHALFFAFRLGDGDVPRGWRQLRDIVQNPPAASGTYSILWHLHVDAYDQSRSETSDPTIHMEESHMTQTVYRGYGALLPPLHIDILGKLTVLTIAAWKHSPELEARYGDIGEYHGRILRQQMDVEMHDTDPDFDELPPLITDVLSQEQIQDILKRTFKHYREKIENESSR